MRKTHLLVLLLAVTLTAAAASAGTTYYNIDDMSGWSSCGSCAGGNVGTWWMKHVASPSLDGSSAEFYLGGKSYANALWWRQLGGNSGAYHFTYDLYFYLYSPSVAQALEFDVNQATGGHKWIFGTECDARYGHVWKVWNTAGRYWVNTYKSCYPAGYKWNHLTIQVERVSGQAHFVSITLNGYTQYINKYFWPESSSAYEINTAFQMDLDSYGQGYSVWIDRMKLTYW
jgi:hypothetical protein